MPAVRGTITSEMGNAERHTWPEMRPAARLASGIGDYLRMG